MICVIFETKRKKEEKRNRLYKKLYVKIDEKAFLKWSKDNFLQYNTKEEFIKYACTCSETEVNDYIYTCNLYEESITNSQMLSIYDSLYNELNDESLDILRGISSRNFRKGLLILEYMNNYGGNNTEDMINKIKKDITWEKERIKEEKRNKRVLKNKLIDLNLNRKQF